MFNEKQKQEILARGRLHHAENGIVMTALKEVLNKVYPDGTNIIKEFLKKLIGLKYGHYNMTMDKATDCEEMYRITFFIFLNMDIGSFSDAAYYSHLGHTVSKNVKDLPNLPPLTLCFYKTSKTKKTGHVAGIWDSKHLFQSGAAILGAKVGITDIFWHKNIFLSAREFLTPEQRELITYRSSVIPLPPPVQPPVKKIQYTGASYMNIRYSPSALAEDIGNVNHDETVIKLATKGSWVKIQKGNTIGWCYNKYFKAV